MTVYRKKSKWVMDVYFPDGRRIRRVFTNKKKALTIESRLKQEIVEQRWQCRFLPSVRFGDFMKKYVSYIREEQSSSTCTANISRIKKHILPYFSKLPLSMITRNRVDSYKTLRKKQQAKPNTIRNELVCLSNVFTMAIRWGYLFYNPVSGIKKPKIPKQPPRFLTETEVDRLLKSCALHLYPIVLCALHTGMRKSELLNLKWADVDLKMRQITIKSNDGYHTKNYDYRHVGINETLFPVLSELGKESEYVFTYQGERIKDVKKALQAAYKKAGLSHGGLHICRHTFASNLIKKGVELEKIQKLLGHQDFSTTLQYAHLSSRSVKDVVNKLDKED